MGLTANVVANAPILSAWGNEIRDRTVQNFASAAERSSQWTSPPEGSMSYLRDVDRVECYSGTVWRVVGPAGYIASGFSTVDTNIPAVTNIDYLTVATPSLAANRRIKITADFQFGKPISGVTAQVVAYLTDPANAILSQRMQHLLPSSAQSTGAAISMTIIATPPAGVYTVKARAGSNTAGSATIYIQECLVVIEDIGFV